MAAARPQKLPPPELLSLDAPPPDEVSLEELLAVSVNGGKGSYEL